MKLYNYLIAMCLTLAASLSHGQLAGKNVLIIQGFLPQHLIVHPADNGKSDSDNYWSTFNASLKNQSTSQTLYYPSNFSLEGSGGIAEFVAQQLEPMLTAGHCDDGCVVITHSTGDLVMRYFLANKEALLGTELSERFNVLAFIDLAGAGGGSELADVGMDIVNGVNVGPDAVEAVADWLGYEIELGVVPGVLYNLQPSVARNIAVNSIPPVPRLRVAATGTEIFGPVTHLVLKGSDDSVVALHSACGAASSEAYKSCTKDLKMNGEITEVIDAPSFEELYDYHYPLILSEHLAHNQMPTDKTGNDMTFALSGESEYMNSGAQTLVVDVEYHELDVWWNWFNDYRYITNAEDKSIGQVIVESFE